METLLDGKQTPKISRGRCETKSNIEYNGKTDKQACEKLLSSPHFAENVCLTNKFNNSQSLPFFRQVFSIREHSVFKFFLRMKYPKISDSVVKTQKNIHFLPEKELMWEGVGDFTKYVGNKKFSFFSGNSFHSNLKLNT
jgi:hypothetical protein